MKLEPPVSLFGVVVLLAATALAGPLDGGATFEMHVNERDLLRDPPADGQPLTAAGSAIRLAKGASIALTLNEPARFAIDCSINRIAFGNNGWDITVTAPRQFVMRGYELGKSTLTLWCEDGRPRSYIVVVNSPS